MSMITILSKINDFDSLDCDLLHSYQHVPDPNKYYPGIYHLPTRPTLISIPPNILSTMLRRTNSIIICIG